MLQQVAISGDTVVSVALVITVIGATWRLSSLLTKISLKLEHLDPVPKQLEGIEDRLESVEEDVNVFWAVIRADDPEKLFEHMRSRVRGKKSNG